MNLFLFSILASTNEALKIRDIAPAIESLPESSRLAPLFWILGITGTLGLLFFFWFLKRTKRTTTPLEQLIQNLKNIPTDPLKRIHTLSQILRELIGIEHEKNVEGWTVQEILPLLSEEENDTRNALLSADAFRFSHEIPDDFPAHFEAHIQKKIKELQEKEAACD